MWTVQGVESLSVILRASRCGAEEVNKSRCLADKKRLKFNHIFTGGEGETRTFFFYKSYEKHFEFTQLFERIPPKTRSAIHATGRDLPATFHLAHMTAAHNCCQS